MPTREWQLYDDWTRRHWRPRRRSHRRSCPISFKPGICCRSHTHTMLSSWRNVLPPSTGRFVPVMVCCDATGPGDAGLVHAAPHAMSFEYVSPAYVEPS